MLDTSANMLQILQIQLPHGQNKVIYYYYIVQTERRSLWTLTLQSEGSEEGSHCLPVLMALWWSLMWANGSHQHA